MLIRLSENARLYHADCRDAIRELPDNSIDSVVTDPPYALVSIVKRFGSPNAAPAKGNDAYMRASAGFMGKQWDTGEVAFSEEFWAEVQRVLKPGGHVAAFGASRGYHRMACAIEDAGFEIRDSIINVIDPESPVINFMQSLNDEQLGAFLRCLDDAEFGGTLAWMYGTGFPKSQNVSKFIDKELSVEGALGAPRSAAHAAMMEAGVARRGEKHEGWNRPWMDDPEAIKASQSTYLPGSPEAQRFDGFGTALKPAFEPIVLARKPLSEGTIAANVLRWGTGALNIDGCRVEAGADHAANCARTFQSGIWKKSGEGAKEITTEAASGGRWPANVVHDGSEEVVAVFPTAGGQQGRAKIGGAKGNSIYGKFAENVTTNPKPRGDSGSAARFFYSAKASKADRNGSKHPTVKPIALIQWLARLITPPGGTVLDPFAGSGTTGAACEREGFDCILVEREAEYVADIQKRFGPVASPLDRLLAWNAAVARYKAAA
jgi:site-specific DNA-methyltransferase (adenine-specific)